MLFRHLFAIFLNKNSDFISRGNKDCRICRNLVMSLLSETPVGLQKLPPSINERRLINITAATKELCGCFIRAERLGRRRPSTLPVPQLQKGRFNTDNTKPRPPLQNPAIKSSANSCIIDAFLRVKSPLPPNYFPPHTHTPSSLLPTLHFLMTHTSVTFPEVLSVTQRWC